MPEYMKAVDIKNGVGPADALFINASTPKPTPGHGEALVKVKAFGLNRMDLLQREGRYPVPPQAPATLGVEFSGVVEALGPGGDSDHGDLAVGDEVFGLAYGGAYAQFVAVSSKMLLRKPSFLSWVQAAGIPETFITATQALHFVLGIRPGQSILWHAGASGVSIAGIQLSLQAGAGAVFATAGTDDKCAFLERDLGATRAFNYKNPKHESNWADEILAATSGRGVDLIVDFVGAPYWAPNMRCVARDGRVCLLGLMGGSVLPAGKKADIGPLLFKRVRVEGSTLRSRDAEYQGRLRDKLEEYLPRFGSGELRVFVDVVLPWEEVVRAHRVMEANTTRGKIVCTVGE